MNSNNHHHNKNVLQVEIDDFEIAAFCQNWYKRLSIMRVQNIHWFVMPLSLWKDER